MMRGGEGFLKRRKRRRHLPKSRTFKKKFRQTDRQTLWFIGKLHFQKDLSSEFLASMFQIFQLEPFKLPEFLFYYIFIAVGKNHFCI